MSSIEIVQKMDLGIEVMHNVGVWMNDGGLDSSEYFKPENMNSTYMLQFTEPNEYYVMMIDDRPAASMILQETERNQSWKSIDGDSSQKALYVHWLCVHRDFAGQGLPKEMLDYAKLEAEKRGFKRLRLDADQQKLSKIYEDLGFILIKTVVEEGHNTAFLEKRL